MRLRALKLLPVVALLCVASLAEAQKLTSKESAKLIEQYLEPATTPAQREEILEKLKIAGIDTKEAAKQLQRAAKKDDQRPRVLQLAITLKVPGLFNTFENAFDSLDQGQIILWILVLRDPDGVKFLFEKWKTLPMDSETWMAIQEGFQEHRQDLLALDLFQPMVADKERGDAAHIVLQTQLDSAELEAEKILKQWPLIRLEYERDFKEFPIRGLNLLAIEGWSGKNTRRRGPNMLIEKGGIWALSELPVKIRGRSFTLTLRMNVLEQGGCRLSFNRTQDGSLIGHGVEERQGKLGVVYSGGSMPRAVAVTIGAWCEVKYVFRPLGARWSADVFVNNVPQDQGIKDYVTDPHDISARANNGRFVIGGFDLEFTDSKK